MNAVIVGIVALDVVGVVLLWRRIAMRLAIIRCEREIRDWLAETEWAEHLRRP